VTPELALAQARQAEAEIAGGHYRGPLHGIPVAVKDICNTAGVVTAAGMAIHTNHVPDFDATVVKRLSDAGAVLLGKLQLTEGAFVNHHLTPALRRAVPVSRPPPGCASDRSAAIPAARSAFPVPPTASPVSSRPGAASVAMASSRWPRVSIISAR
jgi:amidase